MAVHEEQMPWMMAQMLVVNREPRDVSWYHRGEECPH